MRELGEFEKENGKRGETTEKEAERKEREEDIGENRVAREPRGW